jgi:hypothetical protein
MDSIYNIFNQQYIQQQAMLQQQNHIDQINEVQKSKKALKDFLDSADKIQPEYRQIANNEYCAILCDYLMKHI